MEEKRKRGREWWMVWCRRHSGTHHVRGEREQVVGDCSEGKSRAGVKSVLRHDINI
jgi:hypothetical protein